MRLARSKSSMPVILARDDCARRLSEAPKPGDLTRHSRLPSCGGGRFGDGSTSRKTTISRAGRSGGGCRQIFHGVRDLLPRGASYQLNRLACRRAVSFQSMMRSLGVRRICLSEWRNRAVQNGLARGAASVAYC
jgi:hypothetical protein